MKRIELTSGKFAVVDDCDYEYLNQWDWHVSGRYAVRNKPRPSRGVIIRMHRVIMERMSMVSAIVDHIDGDRLNNTRENLHPATHAQNLWNRDLTREPLAGSKECTYGGEVASRYTGKRPTNTHRLLRHKGRGSQGMERSRPKVSWYVRLPEPCLKRGVPFQVTNSPARSATSASRR